MLSVCLSVCLSPVVLKIQSANAWGWDAVVVVVVVVVVMGVGVMLMLAVLHCSIGGPVGVVRLFHFRPSFALHYLTYLTILLYYVQTYDFERGR